MRGDGSGNLPDGLRVAGTASFSYIDADENNALDLPLTNSPRHMAKLNLIAPLVQKRLFPPLTEEYAGRRLTLMQDAVSGFSIFNVTLLGHALAKHSDLSASAYDLLDKKYYDPGRPEDPEDAIQQDGRSFRVKITARF